MVEYEGHTMTRRLIAAGIAGLVGTWVMSEVQRLWTLAADGRAPYSAGGKHDARDWQERVEHRNSNELAAQAVARTILRRELTGNELRIAAPLVHYGFGMTMAILYGAYLERAGRNRSGIAFGVVVWIGADEVAMPVLGLSDSTLKRPAAMHLQSLVAHLAYGTATEMTRRSLQAVI
jgi:hypothetical protein